MSSEEMNVLETYSSGVNVRGILNSNKLVIFGASGNGLALQKHLESMGYSVDYFCDNDKTKWGKKIQGVKIISPEELLKLDQTDYLTCIASMWAFEIAVQLKKLGLRFLDLTYWKRRWENHFDSSIIKDNISNIKKAYSLINDKESKRVFLSILKYRLTLDPSHLIIADFRQYDHPRLNPQSGDLIIDGGAYDGRTSIFFAEKLKGNCQIYAFEPDSDNFKKLVQNLHKKEIKQVIPMMFGLWNKNSVSFMNTKTNSGTGHFIDNTGNEKIELTSIDSFCIDHDLTPNIIKMDIEGSEKEALLGARKTLETANPNLIICVYHKPKDLWDIILYLFSLGLKYKFFISHHGNTLTESVLYCVKSYES